MFNFANFTLQHTYLYSLGIVPIYKTRAASSLIFIASNCHVSGVDLTGYNFIRRNINA